MTAEINLDTKYKQQSSPLHHAASKGNMEIVKTPLAATNMNPNAKGEYDDSALLRSLAWHM